jgi:hypothetical protein
MRLDQDVEHAFCTTSQDLELVHPPPLQFLSELEDEDVRRKLEEYISPGLLVVQLQCCGIPYFRKAEGANVISYLREGQPFSATYLTGPNIRQSLAEIM